MDTSSPSPLGATGAVRKIAMLGNHAPRQCGIATFTTDLSDAIALELPASDVLRRRDERRRAAPRLPPARPLRDRRERASPSYRRAADFLNVNAVDVVCVQHEYGIFGGKAGSHLLSAPARAAHAHRHDAAHDPRRARSRSSARVMDELVRLSERIVVMSEHGATLLREVHGVPERQDRPHPPRNRQPAAPATRARQLLGVEGKSVILTFGLLSPDKGIEYVIDALPPILRRHPDAVYIVLGATHPHVKEHARRGVPHHAREPRAAPRRRLEHHLPRPLRQPGRARRVPRPPRTSTSRPTSSRSRSRRARSRTRSARARPSSRRRTATPRELLADGRGILVPWRDPARHRPRGHRPARRRRAAQRDARARGRRTARSMPWPAVARRYVESFERARAEHAEPRAHRRSRPGRSASGRPSCPRPNLAAPAR